MDKCINIAADAATTTAVVGVIVKTTVLKACEQPQIYIWQVNTTYSNVYKNRQHTQTRTKQTTTRQTDQETQTEENEGKVEKLQTEDRERS